MKLKSQKVTENRSETYTIEGTELEIVKSYIDGKINFVTLHGEGPLKSRPAVVKPSFVDFIKHTNPYHHHNLASEHIVDYKDYKDVDFDQAVTDGLVYYFYYSGNLLFDTHGQIIPLVHAFDYIGTDFHSNRVDIDKAVKVLGEHPWVMNKDALHNMAVPYYSAHGHNHRFISVKLLPDVETYRKMFEMAVTFKKDNIASVRLKELMLGVSYDFPMWDPLQLHILRRPDRDSLSDNDDEDEDN